MTLYQYPDYLMHYDIKGMRWGHRKKYDPHPRHNKYINEKKPVDIILGKTMECQFFKSK